MPTFSSFYWSGLIIVLLFLILSKNWVLDLLINAIDFYLPTLLISVIKLYASFYLFEFIVFKLWSFGLKIRFLYLII